MARTPGAAPRPAWSPACPHTSTGAGLDIAERAGGRLVNGDRMWHYPRASSTGTPVWTTTGSAHPARAALPVARCHGQAPACRRCGRGSTRSAPCGAPAGNRPRLRWSSRPAHHRQGVRALGTEQNPDLTGKDCAQVLGPGQTDVPDRAGSGLPRPRRGLRRGAEPRRAGKKMNELTGTDLIEAKALGRLMMARDQQVASGLGKDPQVVATAAARRYVGDRLTRIVRPHRFLDDSGDSLVAVRCHVLTRKTLGGLETDLSARVLGSVRQPLSGVFAAGEAAGFGGGGVHGYRALEGTLLAACSQVELLAARPPLPLRDTLAAAVSLSVCMTRGLSNG